MPKDIKSTKRSVSKKPRTVNNNFIDNTSYLNLLDISVTKRTKVVLDEWLGVKLNNSKYTSNSKFTLCEQQIKPVVVNKSIKIDNIYEYTALINSLPASAMKVLNVIITEIVHKSYMRTQWKDFELNRQEYIYSNLVFMPYPHYKHLCTDVIHIPALAAAEFSKAIIELIKVGIIIKHQDVRSLYHFNIYHLYSHDRAVTIKQELDRRGLLVHDDRSKIIKEALNKVQAGLQEYLDTTDESAGMEDLSKVLSNIFSTDNNDKELENGQDF